MFGLEEHEYVVSYVAADGSKRIRWMTADGREAVRQTVLAEGGSVIYIRRDDDDYEAARSAMRSLGCHAGVILAVLLSLLGYFLYTIW